MKWCLRSIAKPLNGRATQGEVYEGKRSRCTPKILGRRVDQIEVAMSERFKLIYDQHLWIRCICWGTLLLGMLFFFKVPGGFPPTSWRLLALTIPQVTHLWASQGTAIVRPLAVLSIQSLSYLLIYLCVVCGWIAVIHHWRQNVRERRAFARGVQEQFEKAVQQRQEQQRQQEQRKQQEQQQMAQEHISQFRIPACAQMSAFQTAPNIGQAQLANQTSQAYSTSYTGPTNHVNQMQQAKRVETTQIHGLAASVQWQRKLQLRLEVGSGWDVGIKRKKQPNEDSMIAMQGTCIYNNALLPFALLVIADGMGGHAAGQDASYLAVQAMVQWVAPHIAGVNAMSDELLAELLADGVRQANLAVCQRSQEVGSDMGTTITAALVLDSKAYVVNVGDSRTYLYRESAGLRQITHDHSLVAQLIAAGRITPDEVYTHPDRNQVYRGLGDKRDVEVDSFMLTLQTGDRLLLCSDGLWEMVRDPEIARILQQTEWNPVQTSNALIQSALNGGGLDNISAIVAQVMPITL
jgi:serine/threonine protein phosphatase PrpC